MKGTIGDRRLLRPRNLPDALRLLAEDDTLTPLAGCTDLYVSLNFGTLTGTRFLDLWPLRELAEIRVSDDMLVIGALATHAQIVRSNDVRAHLPMLAAACREIGGVQIQARGTLGGNIANGSPAGDSLPVLAAADAVVVLRSQTAERRVPFNEFYTGYRASVRRPDELIVAVEIPPVTGRQWFRKVGTRAAQAISKVVAAGVRAPRPRIAYGSVAATVVRARAAEEALARGASLDEAVAALAEDVRPVDDLRSTAAYRARVAANLLRRFWSDTEG